VDQSGYLVRTDVYDENMRPTFQLGPQEEGTWQVLKELVKLPTEGWFSLWKGKKKRLLHLITQQLPPCSG